MSRIGVLVVDGEALVRRALEVFISADEGMALVGEAADGAAAVRRALALRPDVILMDVRARVADGVEATRELLSRLPEAKVLALTTRSSEPAVIPVLRAGAAGVLVMDTEPHLLLDAIRVVHAGGLVLSDAVTRRLIASVVEAPEPATRVELPAAQRLTDRELSIVQLLAKGRSNAEIARQLNVSEATVKTHLGRVMVKWEVRDRIQVLIRATRSSLVTL